MNESTNFQVTEDLFNRLNLSTDDEFDACRAAVDEQVEDWGDVDLDRDCERLESRVAQLLGWDE